MTKEKYKCEYCKQESSRRYNMEIHVNRKHPYQYNKFSFGSEKFFVFDKSNMNSYYQFMSHQNNTNDLDLKNKLNQLQEIDVIINRIKRLDVDHKLLFMIRLNKVLANKSYN